MVVSIVAAHGQTQAGTQGIQNAQRAYRAGMATLDTHHTNLVFNDDWQPRLDAALASLVAINPQEKYRLVKALSATVAQDGIVVTAEQELVRVVCALLHVPFPMLMSTKKQDTHR